MAQPGDEWVADDETFGGSLAQVVRVAESSEVVYAAFHNGNIVRLVAEGPTAIDVGDVVLIGDSRWLVVEPELWAEPRGIGVVRQAIDTRLLIEAPGGLILTEQAGIPAKTGNTVRYSVAEGVVEVLADQPLSSQDHQEETADVSRFRLPDEPGSLRYSDFGGYKPVVNRARHIIETQFDQKQAIDAIGAKPVRGVLFSGAPGTGKTYLGRVIAAESRAAFFLVSGPAIVSKYVGDTEEMLRNIFNAAQKEERAIVFFDEIDSIAETRNEGSHESSNRLVAQLLTEMDGFSETQGNVIVLAATNRPDSIDPALRRPGRFDWEITFDLPTLEDRLEILEVDARRLATAAWLPLEDIAAGSESWSSAELASIWTEAALLAASDGRHAIDGEDMFEAFSLVSDSVREKRK